MYSKTNQGDQRGYLCISLPPSSSFISTSLSASTSYHVNKNPDVWMEKQPQNCAHFYTILKLATTKMATTKQPIVLLHTHCILSQNINDLQNAYSLSNYVARVITNAQ